MNLPHRPAGAVSAWRWGLPALLLLGVLLAWPLGALAGYGLLAGATPEELRAAVSDTATWERLAISAGQALLSTALSMAVGIPVAFVLSQIRFPGRGLVRALFTLPLFLPAIVLALAFQQFLGPSGWLNVALDRAGRFPIEVTGTLWGILITHTCFGVALVVRLVGGAWAGRDARHEEAARMLGADGGQAFRHVTLPALRPAITAAAVLTFLFAFTSFAIVVLLGAPGLDTVEVAIYRLLARRAPLPTVAVLSMLQLLVTLTALGLYASLQRRLAMPPRHRVERVRPLRATSWRERGAIAIVLLVLLALVVVPLASMVLGAFTRDGVLTTAHFSALLTDAGTATSIAPLETIGWSVAFALGAAVIALIAGGTAALAAAHARGDALLGTLLLLPIALPPVVLGLAYALAFSAGWLDLRGSPVLVLLAQALVAYPFALRAVLPAARAVDPRLTEAATVLGASPARAWRRVQLPVLRRAFVAGAAIAFVVAMSELGATLLLRRPGFTTAPVAILDALGRPGPDALGRALALATVLMGVTVVAFVIIERFRPRDAGEA